MNFLFISPNFPESYWMFCAGLKKHGVNVLAIIDTEYDKLNENVKNSFNDCFRVNSLLDYDEMMRAVAFLTYKHGKIDWIESNNEFWLRQDARLRKDFNITNGMAYDRMDDFQSKSKMKEFYAKANLPTARYAIATTFEAAKEFVALVGYPIVIKPDVGVGASDTHKIKNEDDLKAAFDQGFATKMIMEEYIDGDVFTFDGITNSKKEILFMTNHVYTDSLMECVNNKSVVGCYSLIDIPQDVQEAGKRVVESFDTKSRFYHFEFFRLRSDKEGVGKAGDILGLEVNMRPPGGFMPDIINYANDCNCHQLWADMIVTDTIAYKQERKYSAGFLGRRDNDTYAHSIDEIKNKYGAAILSVIRVDKALAPAMGEEAIIARFPSEAQMEEFMKWASELQ